MCAKTKRYCWHISMVIGLQLALLCSLTLSPFRLSADVQKVWQADRIKLLVNGQWTEINRVNQYLWKAPNWINNRNVQKIQVEWKPSSGDTWASQCMLVNPPPDDTYLPWAQLFVKNQTPGFASQGNAIIDGSAANAITFVYESISGASELSVRLRCKRHQYGDWMYSQTDTIQLNTRLESEQSRTLQNDLSANVKKLKNDWLRKWRGRSAVEAKKGHQDAYVKPSISQVKEIFWELKVQGVFPNIPSLYYYIKAGENVNVTCEFTATAIKKIPDVNFGIPQFTANLILVDIVRDGLQSDGDEYSLEQAILRKKSESYLLPLGVDKNHKESFDLSLHFVAAPEDAGWYVPYCLIDMALDNDNVNQVPESDEETNNVAVGTTFKIFATHTDDALKVNIVEPVYSVGLGEAVPFRALVKDPLFIPNKLATVWERKLSPSIENVSSNHAQQQNSDRLTRDDTGATNQRDGSWQRVFQRDYSEWALLAMYYVYDKNKDSFYIDAAVFDHVGKYRVRAISVPGPAKVDGEVLRPMSSEWQYFNIKAGGKIVTEKNQQLGQEGGAKANKGFGSKVTAMHKQFATNNGQNKAENQVSTMSRTSTPLLLRKKFGFTEYQGAQILIKTRPTQVQVNPQKPEMKKHKHFNLSKVSIVNKGRKKATQVLFRVTCKKPNGAKCGGQYGSPKIAALGPGQKKAINLGLFAVSQPGKYKIGLIVVSHKTASDASVNMQGMTNIQIQGMQRVGFLNPTWIKEVSVAPESSLVTPKITKYGHTNTAITKPKTVTPKQERHPQSKPKSGFVNKPRGAGIQPK